MDQAARRLGDSDGDGAGGVVLREREGERHMLVIFLFLRSRKRIIDLLVEALRAISVISMAHSTILYVSA